MADLSKLPPVPPGCAPPGVTDQRGQEAFRVRYGTALNEAVATAGLKHTPNDDEVKYADKSGTYSKALAQTGPGLVDKTVFGYFRAALGSSDGTGGGSADFETHKLIGCDVKLNGPLGAFAYHMAGADSEAFGDSVVPAAPSVASPAYAVELMELYWASLLRDVPFTAYPGNATAIAAAKELTRYTANYAGPTTTAGEVTPELLFRGGLRDHLDWFAGERAGPYISQLAIYPTNLGAQRLDQKLQTFAAGQDFLTDPAEWARIQDGCTPAFRLNIDPLERYLHDGRGLGAYTHQDELYQAYLVAYLVLKSWNAPFNAGTPYSSLNRNAYKNQQPFGTFGGPDIAATLAAVAKVAINAVWYQKWIIHLRHRPESGGGLVQLMKDGTPLQAQVDPIIFDSLALHLSHLRNGSWLLSQAFPEGSPPHPAYPTGHGAVAGACITVLKFFYEGGKKVTELVPVLQPSEDGLSLEPYPGVDAGEMTVNGELHKLAHNISFGHGIHAGIHWRSDTDYSLLLGEAVALKFLQDNAWTYRENFKVEITRMDNSKVTIYND